MRSYALSFGRFFFTLAMTSVALAQDNLRQRLMLAKELQKVWPVKEQVENAVEAYLIEWPEEERAAQREAVEEALNIKVLEKVSVDAYAQTFTAQELQALLDYYSNPAAKTAEAKREDYFRLVYPEIIKMLDKAMMRVRLGSGP